MRSYARRSQGHRGKISIHAHDDAAHADRLPETRIEVHASRRPKITTGCHGFAPQASVRSTRFSCVILVIPSGVEESLTISEPSTDVSPLLHMTNAIAHFRDYHAEIPII